MQTRTTSFLVGTIFVGCLAALAIAEPAPPEIPPAEAPGAIANDGHTIESVCSIIDGLTYSKRHRATSTELKREIRSRDACDPHNSEVDHRVPLALGGADERDNLWCEPGAGPFNYHKKDRLEEYAWESVCKHHTMTLPAAQAMFLAPADWRIAYCTVFATDPDCDSLQKSH